jgi:hypothetical protein
MNLVAEETSKARRTTGVSLLCFLFAWLAVAGFGNAWVMLTRRTPGLPAWMGGIAICYGLAAGSVCIGLWRMRRWALGALRVWLGVCGALLIGFIAVFPSSMFLGGYWGVLAFLAILGLFLFALDRYVQKSVGTTVQ